MLNHHQTSWTFPLVLMSAAGYLQKLLLDHHLPLFLKHIKCKLSIHHFYNVCTSNITSLSWDT